jgi:hypothetical protein
MQKAALMRRPLKRSPGCCTRGSVSGDMGESEVKLKRRNRSMPDEPLPAVCTGWDLVSDGSVVTALAPGRPSKYEGASLDIFSRPGVELVAWVYASFLRALNPGPTRTGFGWSSGTCAGLSGWDMTSSRAALIWMGRLRMRSDVLQLACES